MSWWKNYEQREEADTERSELPCDYGFYGVSNAGRLHDEPEEHVGHVDNPDGL